MRADQSDLPLIEPGVPSESYLWLKLNGGPDPCERPGAAGISNAQMPLGGALSDSDIAMVKSWIYLGAPE